MDGSGVAAGGLVRIELDGGGRLRDVVLDPRVAHLPVEELREALISAFTDASTASIDPAFSVETDRISVETDRLSAETDRLKAASAEAIEIADRRFAEISTALYDLSRRAVRTW